MTLSPGAGLRLVILALALLVAFQILIVGVGFFLRIRDLGEPTRPQIINQIAGAAALLDDKDAEERNLALRAINSPFIRYSLLDVFPHADHEARALPRYRPIVDAYQRSLPNRPFRLIVREGAAATLWGDFRIGKRVIPVELVFFVGLKDGSALVVEPSPEYRRQVFINFLALMSSLVGVALLIGLVLASFATARPLARMAADAQAFAADLDAPPFPENKGPEPVRRLARAFNRMRTDIRSLVAERQTTLAAVAHDYRTYLTRLRLRVEQIEDAEQRGKAIDDIEEMSALIDDTLFFAAARHAGGALETLDFAALVRGVVEGLVETGAEAQIVGGDAPLLVSAHPRALKRAVVNLAENAVKYGRVARLSLERRDGETVLAVEDDGEGVPDAALARLAEPFFRVENSRSRQTGGAGLGLAIAKMLVEASGGRLAFSRAEKGGLRAEIVLQTASTP
ncbi:MAG: HAMP domain-containing protein [Parvularculaceae bacterium]|nr:HAMP domain-containing protein [Parvularculaceae bacterium]